VDVRKWQHTLWMTTLAILCIIYFPVNSLVLTGVLEPNFHLASFIAGWVVWAIGMMLVMVPIVMLPRRGVPKGKTFVRNIRLVHTGIYAIVRRPQYLGGVLSIFVTTLLLYPHWLFTLDAEGQNRKTSP